MGTLSNKTKAGVAKKEAASAGKKAASKRPVQGPITRQQAAGNGPVQGPITRQQAAGGGPVQGPVNYKGRYFKDKAIAEARKEGRKEGASAARKKIKKSLSKINRGSKKVKKAVKATKKKVGKALKSPVGAIAAYEGTKAGYNKLTGSGKKKKTNGSYFTQAELDAARKRLYGTK